MKRAKEGEESGELATGGGGRWSKMHTRGEGLKVVIIHHLAHRSLY